MASDSPVILDAGSTSTVTPISASPPPAANARFAKRFLALDDFEAAARSLLPRPIFGYISGAAETNASLRDNRKVFDEWGFVPRALVNVSQRDTSIELFGRRYQSPIGVAPMGVSALSAYRGDIVQARAALRQGVPMILSGTSLIKMETVMDEAPGTWFQAYLPRHQHEIASFVARIAAAGTPVLVVTVDAAVTPNRENNVRNNYKTPLQPNLSLLWSGITHPRWALGTFLRTLIQHGMPHFENLGTERGLPLVARDLSRDFSGREHLDWDTLRAIRQQWHGPLVVKGLLHPDDAATARNLGADGIIVSNHGGRQLDGAVSPMRVLEPIVAAAGPMTVMVDSGFRRGTDVLKALALGAKCAFVGRPFNYAAALGGETGVHHAIGLLAAEVRASLGMLGLTRIDDLSKDLLMRRP
jgi:L-lactate dehydrogenase (cytochrome)